MRDLIGLGGGHGIDWKVAGPAGIPVEWEATITKQVPNKMLAWESMAGSMIEQKGIVRFQPNGDGGTRLAKLFGADASQLKQRSGFTVNSGWRRCRACVITIPAVT
jgi:hypothetical protein